jgi:hypothetical protein
VYRLHIETVLSLFLYSKTSLYLSIALWLFLEFVLSIDVEKALDTISWKLKKDVFPFLILVNHFSNG